MAGSERYRQGKQRYLAWEQSHQDKKWAVWVISFPADLLMSPAKNSEAAPLLGGRKYDLLVRTLQTWSVKSTFLPHISTGVEATPPESSMGSDSSARRLCWGAGGEGKS